ncbi:MAG: STM4013/SEN3800 family hydrolase [Saezia sp.]
MLNMKHIVGTHDIIWIVLDTLRYDVAQQSFKEEKLGTLGQYLPASGWELGHTPASFTFPAHQAFFAGFLPTPARPGKQQRLFASEFTGSESSGENTFTFQESNLVHALAAKGYHTACIGGVGFFNPEFALGRVLPSLFNEQYWSQATSTGSKHSVEKQVTIAQTVLQKHALDAKEHKPLFLFINTPAIHSPNRMYLPAAHPDQHELNSLAGHKAALLYTDKALKPLFESITQHGKPTFVIVCSDHGTAYGEDGYKGHRLAHQVVWEVPYTHFLMNTKNETIANSN